MFNLKLLFLIAFIGGLLISNALGDDSTTEEKFKKFVRPAELPDIQLFAYYKSKLNFYDDNKFELNLAEHGFVFLVADYMIANPERSVLLRSWQHENEEKGMALKRAEFIKEMLVDIGANPKRIIFKIERAVIPQDPSDIFTSEELIEARRVDLTIIR